MWHTLIFSLVFFFKQKTAYEMRISYWSSDVCSSDLAARASRRRGRTIVRARKSDRRMEMTKAIASTMPRRSRSARTVRVMSRVFSVASSIGLPGPRATAAELMGVDRKSVVEGQRGSGRVDLGGRRLIKKKKSQANQ